MTGPALDEQAQRMLRQWRQLPGEDIPDARRVLRELLEGSRSGSCSRLSK
jgi:hypothetical protein